MERGMEAVIEQVRSDQEKYGEASQGPATPDAVARAREAVQARFGATLPADFAAFLERANGVDYNGVVIYGANQSEAAPGPNGFWQGVVAANAAWRDGPGHEEYLVLGETDMDLLTVDLSGADPVLRDKVSSDVNETFGSVADAIETVLKQRL
jgi:hypothetical protein